MEMTWVRPKKDELRQVLKVDGKPVGEVYLSFGWWCAQLIGQEHHTRHCTVFAAQAALEERL